MEAEDEAEPSAAADGRAGASAGTAAAAVEAMQKGAAGVDDLAQRTQQQLRIQPASEQQQQQQQQPRQQHSPVKTQQHGGAQPEASAQAAAGGTAEEGVGTAAGGPPAPPILPTGLLSELYDHLAQLPGKSLLVLVGCCGWRMCSVRHAGMVLHRLLACNCPVGAAGACCTLVRCTGCVTNCSVPCC
jgi:hypothetical protein